MSNALITQSPRTIAERSKTAHDFLCKFSTSTLKVMAADLANSVAAETDTTERRKLQGWKIAVDRYIEVRREVERHIVRGLALPDSEKEPVRNTGSTSTLFLARRAPSSSTEFSPQQLLEIYTSLKNWGTSKSVVEQIKSLETPLVEPKVQYLVDGRAVIFVATLMVQEKNGSESFYSGALKDKTFRMNCHKACSLILPSPEAGKDREMAHFYRIPSFGKVNCFAFVAEDGAPLRFWHSNKLGEESKTLASAKMIVRVSRTNKVTFEELEDN